MIDYTGLDDEYEHELYMMRVRAGRDEYFEDGERPFVVSDTGRQVLAEAAVDPLAAAEALHDACITFNRENTRLEYLADKVLTGEGNQVAIDAQAAVVRAAWRDYVAACQAAPAPGMYVSGLIEVAHRDLLDQKGANHDSV